MSDTAPWASEVAESLLADALPRRWRHSQGVARTARSLAGVLGDRADLLEAAAWLHDIGYSPSLDVTGFHPLDGARYLRDVLRVDMEICRLVAHHSCAILEAEQRGLAAELAAEFPMPDASLWDALTYCDVTTSPDGRPVTVTGRIAEIRQRYGAGHLVTEFIGRAEPHMIGAVRRIQRRLGLDDDGIPPLRVVVQA
ncbi:MAG TPA: HD domain-containing protein [Streptosporangiaceae bacterium]|nr:HD domain-containing protein [Streptosporangiaceae bacterium]